MDLQVWRKVRQVRMRRLVTGAYGIVLLVVVSTLSLFTMHSRRIELSISSTQQELQTLQAISDVLSEWSSMIMQASDSENFEEQIAASINQLRTSPTIAVLPESINKPFKERLQILNNTLSQSPPRNDLFLELASSQVFLQNLSRETVAKVLNKIDILTRTSSFLKAGTVFLLFVAFLITLIMGFILTKSVQRHASTLNQAAERVRRTVQELHLNSKEQQKGAEQQAGSVEETKRTLETLVSTANNIAETSRNVLKNAEVSQMTNQRISQRIKDLSKSTERIGEILELIKEVANKSDILSLNAALEGSKAGEAGKGFSLVASQMQRLASHIMGSVNSIKQLTAEVMEATNSSVMATEEANKMAEATTRSARQISQAARLQQTGTEQVNKAITAIASSAHGHVRSVGGLSALATSLQSISQELSDLSVKI